MKSSTLLAVLLAAAAVPAAAQDDLRWSYDVAIAPSPHDTVLSLAFGVPQSGSALLQATCSIGANWVFATLTVDTDVGGLAAGASASLTVSGNRFRASYGAVVIRSDEGLAGVRLAMPLDDPLWAAMTGPLPLSFGVDGHDATALPPAPPELVQGFRSDCSGIAALSPQATGK